MHIIPSVEILPLGANVWAGQPHIREPCAVRPSPDRHYHRPDSQFLHDCFVIAHKMHYSATVSSTVPFWDCLEEIFFYGEASENSSNIHTLICPMPRFPQA